MNPAPKKNMTDAGPPPIEPCPVCGSDRVLLREVGPSNWKVCCQCCGVQGPASMDFGRASELSDPDRARAGWSALAGLRLSLLRIAATRKIDVVDGIVRAEHILDIADEELRLLKPDTR